MSDQGYAGDITPQEAWEMLAGEADTVLVDVRTPAEWSYVGIPDLESIGKRPLLVPWALYPDNQINPTFMVDMASVGARRDQKLLFLCRSGVRSRAAAIAMTDAGYGPCHNIASGFEGDRDENRHRGTVGGWKVDGLPWIQG